MLSQTMLSQTMLSQTMTIKSVYLAEGGDDRLNVVEVPALEPEEEFEMQFKYS